MDAADPPFYRNDLWTLDDDFGLGRAGDQVARMALDVQAPFTLGVTGKWGAGKTSVLRRAFVTLGGRPIRQKLLLAEPREEAAGQKWSELAWNSAPRKAELGWPAKYYPRLDGMLCVWFSPWQHQNEPNPLVPLVREIQAQFESRLKAAGKTLNRRGGLAAAKLLEHVVDAAATLATGRPVTLARGLSEGMQRAWREAEPDLLAPSDGQRFHLLFEDAVNELLTAVRESHAGTADLNAVAKHARLVVFIDDLDRCEEEVIVRLLEAIKLYLSSRHCVFILGLDDGAVLDALRRHWKERSDDSNREYLEKLFQATLAVPLPRSAAVCAGIERQLAYHHIPTTAAAEARRQLARDIECLLEPNPRKVKNFVNSLCATWAMGRAGEWAVDAEARRFVLFHYLRQFHRPVWRLVEHEPQALHLLWAVLSRAADSDIDAARFPGGLQEQRLLREIFYRAFSHVLRPTDPEAQAQHGNESLEQAVKAFEQRRDRRRSDEQFRRLFTTLVDKHSTLHPRHLYLDDDPPPGGNP